MEAIKSGWSSVKTFLIAQLKGEFVKFALKKVLGTAAMGGFKAWIVSFIAKELYDEIGEPVIKAVLRKGRYQYEVLNGKMKIYKLDRSPDDNSYDDNVTDIFR